MTFLLSLLNHFTSPAWPQLSCHSAPPAGEDGELRENKVRSMATQLLAKFEENSSTTKSGAKVRGRQLENLSYVKRDCEGKTHKRARLD